MKQKVENIRIEVLKEIRRRIIEAESKQKNNRRVLDRLNAWRDGALSLCDAGSTIRLHPDFQKSAPQDRVRFALARRSEKIRDRFRRAVKIALKNAINKGLDERR